MLQAGQRIAGKYELERELGKGGMGAVWLARHVELGERRVAVKFLLNTLSADMLARFRREALLASQIQTRHAVAVLDFGDYQGAPYLVMEYLQGQDLRGLLDQRSRLDPALATAILEQAARGLQKAHDAGLIHRDIKPENLFLTQDEDGGMLVKVLDFGIAKSTNADSGTATGTMMGTAYYMSPEQFQGAKGLDHRTDLWSLACVGYEMLVGARVFGGDSVLMIGMKILGQERPVPSRMVAGLPPGLDAWLAKALHPDLNQRFGSASELNAAFAQAVGRGGSAAPGLSLLAGAQPAGASRLESFSTTAMANSTLEAAATTPPKRRWVPMVIAAAGFATVAVVSAAGWVALKSSAEVSDAPAGGLVASAPATPSAGPPAAASASSAAQGEASPLERAVTLVREGDADGAHRLLAAVPSDSPLRSDERFTEVENAWADRQLDEAQKLRDVEQKARLLGEVVKSGADEARQARARSLLAAIARPPAGKTVKEAAPKEPATTAPPTPPAPPPTSTSTGSLPSRY